MASLIKRRFFISILSNSLQVRRLSSISDSLKRLDRTKQPSGNSQNEIDNKINVQGYNEVLKRAANIIIGITEHNSTKLLHIHLDGRLIKNIGNVIPTEYKFSEKKILFYFPQF